MHVSNLTSKMIIHISQDLGYISKSSAEFVSGGKDFILILQTLTCAQLLFKNSRLVQIERVCRRQFQIR